MAVKCDVWNYHFLGMGNGTAHIGKTHCYLQDMLSTGYKKCCPQDIPTGYKKLYPVGDPAVLPANLTLGMSMSQSEAWESSGAIEPDTPQTPTHLLLSQRNKSLSESFSRSPDLTLSPIQKEQELAWAPE